VKNAIILPGLKVGPQWFYRVKRGQKRTETAEIHRFGRFLGEMTPLPTLLLGHIYARL
jgi:hypothetical protein